MSNDKHNEDSLERLFRKKAGEYDIPYREEDWLKLKNQLDIREAQAIHNRRVRWLAAASVLIISLLGYFTYDHHTKINRLNGQLSEALSEQSPQSESIEPENAEPPLSETQPREGNVHEGSSGENTNSGLPDGLTPVPAPAESDDEVDQVDDPAGDDIEFGEFFVQGITERVAEQASCKDCTLSRFAHRIAQLEPVKIHPPGRERAEPERISEKLAFSYSEGRESSGATLSGLSAGVVVSPDFSTTGSLSNFTSPGYKIGVSISYRIHPRFSVTTGILQSDVKYTAKGEDYNAPEGYWSYGVSADEVVARCLILDIPIRLQYEIMQLGRSRFFATAGMSSYIMLSENYRFRYNGDDTGLRQEWDKNTGTRHWFSNAGFSAGYEYDVHPNWSLRVEPFVQVPISEVGWGNVNLYSAGTMVAFTYRFQK